MSTPDEKAAAFDPAATPPPPVTKVSDLTQGHIGLSVEISGVAGELVSVHNEDLDPAVRSDIGIQESGRPFVTHFEVEHDARCTVVNEDLLQLTDMIGMDEFYNLARELDRVSEEIRKNKAANETLTERKRQLSEKLLGTFAQVGEETLAFSNGEKPRRAYVFHEIVPQFEEKEDGQPFTYRDLVPVLQAMGREEQITEATVNYRTLQGLLREMRDGVIPMPPEMAKIVKIGERVEVRTGVGRKSRR